jgi:gluconate 2-dehydrogenase alpha chain
MSWRFREDDFQVRTSTIEKYGEEALPEGTAIADWAVTYDEMEPYYEKVEKLLGVSGKGGANTFESPRQSDYPLPPLQRFGGGEYLGGGMDDLGYHPFPVPSAILSEAYDGRPACTYCGYCTGFGCWNDSKSSTLVTAIPRAEATGNLEIRTNSRVFRVLTDDNGRASGVVYRGDDGAMYMQPAKVVILSAYTFENIRLLLLSSNDQFPNGLANNAGQVGKYFIGHTYLSAYGTFPGINFNRFSGGQAQSAAMDDLNGDNFDHTGLGFIRGGVTTAGPSESTPIAGSRQVPPSVPQWGSDYANWLRENANSVMSMLIQLETLPYENNFLDLDPEEVDEDGIPVVRVTYNIGENEKKFWDYAGPKLEELLAHKGATETWRGDAIPLVHTTHDVGGARAGDDPSTSVLDKHLLSHEVPNLAVLGGAGFASIAGYNPTQTIEAWAWLAAEHIAENFDSIVNTGG